MQLKIVVQIINTMHCRNSELLYVFLFLLIFVISHLMLMRYHMSYMSMGRKYIVLAGETRDVFKTVDIQKSNGFPPLPSNFAKIHRMSPRNMRKFRNIKEPPIPADKEDEYALNIKYFRRQANYTIFRYTQIITLRMVPTKFSYFVMNIVLFSNNS